MAGQGVYWGIAADTNNVAEAWAMEKAVTALAGLSWPTGAQGAVIYGDS